MDAIEKAVSCFREGHTCSQAILSTFGPECGLDRETALRLAQPFGAGMARSGCVCGAVSGSLMVIGLKHGMADLKDKAAKEKAYKLSREFIKRFEKKQGSIQCRDLLDCDISTTTGLALAVVRGLFKTRCPVLVGEAARILEDLL